MGFKKVYNSVCMEGVEGGSGIMNHAVKLERIMNFRVKTLVIMNYKR